MPENTASNTPSSESPPLTADDLLASPRGRSLVLNVVTDGDDEDWEEGTPLAEFGEAMFFASYVLDRKRRIASAIYGGDDAEIRRRDVQPAEVAEALRPLDPVAPTQAELEQAMAEVIGSAMYWQPPHSEDIITEDPAMIAALRPWAEALVDSGLLDSWATGPDLDDQWDLTWDVSEHTGDTPIRLSADPVALLSGDVGVPSPGTAAATLRQWAADVRASEEGYRREFATDPHTAISGEWWSTPPLDLTATTGTWPGGEPIGLRLVEDDFGPARARTCRLRLRDDVSVAVVDTPEQWAALCRRYPLDVTAHFREVWFEATGRRGRWVIPDWSRVVEDVDGVHVSLAGYLRTAGAVVDVGDAGLLPEDGGRPRIGDTDERTASLMAGWDPDTTYWLTDAVLGIADVVDWAVDDESDAWATQPRRERP